MGSIEEENQQALDALENEKKEAAKFTEGITGAGFGESKEDKAGEEKPGEEKKPEDQGAGTEKKPEPGTEAKPPESSEGEGAKKPEENGEKPPEGGEEIHRKGKYIPIDKYQDEKKQWKETEAQKDARIAELEGELGKAANKPEGSKAEEDAIKVYAEKHNVDVESVKELIGILRSSDVLPKDKMELIDRASKHAQMVEEQQLFDQEFGDVLPSLKEQYPTATEAQLKSAKELLWKESHTKDMADKDMDYVVFKTKGKLAEVFKGAAPEPKGTKGIESGTVGHGKNTTVGGKDFEGKDDFTTLMQLPEEDQARIVREMSPETRIKFYQWSGNQEGIEVNRGGRKIVLK